MSAHALTSLTSRFEVSPQKPAEIRQNTNLTNLTNLSDVSCVYAPHVRPSRATRAHRKAIGAWGFEVTQVSRMHRGKV